MTKSHILSQGTVARMKLKPSSKTAGKFHQKQPFRQILGILCQDQHYGRLVARITQLPFGGCLHQSGARIHRDLCRYAAATSTRFSCIPVSVGLYGGQCEGLALSDELGKVYPCTRTSVIHLNQKLDSWPCLIISFGLRMMMACIAHRPSEVPCQ